MEKQILESYLKKNKVKLVLVNNYVYTGQLIDISEESVLFIDKFGCACAFKLEDIAAVMELQNER